MTKTTFEWRMRAGDLAQALGLLKGIVMSRSAINVLTTVLFKGGRLTATDLDQTLTVTVPTLAHAGALAIPLRALRVVRLIDPDSVITLSRDTGALNLRHGHAWYELPCVPAADFPTTAAATGQSLGGNAISGLLPALRAVRYALSTEETRYYLHGACLTRIDGEAVAVATNGHELAWGLLNAPMPDAWYGAIIPRLTIETLLLIGTIDRLTVQNDTGDSSASGVKRLTATAPGITLHSKLIDGAFPDVNRVILKRLGGNAEYGQTDWSMILPVDAVRAALRRLGALQDDRDRAVRLVPQGTHRLDLVVETVADTERLALMESIRLPQPHKLQAATWADPHTLYASFNNRYLQRFLQHAAGEVCTVHGLMDPRSFQVGAPIGTTDGNGGRLLMPMQSSIDPKHPLIERFQSMSRELAEDAPRAA
ncbi:MAG: DNA polymerase III subunit beta [Pseudomonadota bacterium]